MNPFSELLSRAARELDTARIPYMIIGGQAQLIHGEPRMTEDVDITLGIGMEGIESLLALAERAGWKPLPEDPKAFALETFVVPCRDSRTGIRLDLVLSWSEYEAQAIRRARPIFMEGSQVRYATVEDLLIHKVIAGRPRDLEDVRVLVAKNPELDKTYVDRWLHDLGQAMDEPLQMRLADCLAFRA